MSAAVRLGPLHETAWPSGGAGVLRRDAAEQGYVFLRALVPAGDVLALRTRVLEACREIGWLDEEAPADSGVVRTGVRIGAHDAAWTALQCRVATVSEFACLRAHPAIVGALQALFGGSVRSGRGDLCRVFSPGAPELTTPPHQDRFYVRGDSELWTVWIPLGDCPRELGGLAVLPGSQRSGLRPHDGEGAGRRGVAVGPEAAWAGADYRCGDVLMFHGLTLHRALENRTADRLRLSADFRYEPLAGVTSR